MITLYLNALIEWHSALNVFRYITVRAAMAGITAFAITLVIGKSVIHWLAAMDLRQTIKREGFAPLYAAHQGKEKTPTMGGVMILGPLILATVIWADITNRYVLICLFTVVWLGVVGFIDDYLKLSKKNSKGLTAANKMIGQLSISLGIGLFLYFDSPAWSAINIPFLKNIVLVMGPLYIAFVCAVITGASNAVNLTDGLDGLAVGCTLMIAFSYGIFSYVTGHAGFSHYLQVPFISGTGEMAVFCAALFGAGMGFLWFNSHPASLFMGDVGSLSLGGALGVVAVLTKKEFLLALVGGIFVLEALSVILQVGSYKLRKKRIFLMAPIHHHFQLKGLSESKVVIRFWMVSMILSLIGIVTLKFQ